MNHGLLAIAGAILWIGGNWIDTTGIVIFGAVTFGYATGSIIAMDRARHRAHERTDDEWPD